MPVRGCKEIRTSLRETVGLEVVVSAVYINVVVCVVVCLVAVVVVVVRLWLLSLVSLLLLLSGYSCCKRDCWYCLWLSYKYTITSSPAGRKY